MLNLTYPLHRFMREYGVAVLLALLVHGLLLALLLTMTFSQPVQLAISEPITSFIYQAPTPIPAPELAPEIAPITEQKVATIKQKLPALLPKTASERHNGQDIKESLLAEQTSTLSNASLAQRAFNRVTTLDPAAIEQAARASYQQFLHTQQQPQLTVDKKHWPLSSDPAQQVVAQLNDGKQLIRNNGGCRIADPTLDGFEALMAAKLVPCPDEVSTSEMLKQALQKHSKR